MPDHVEAQSAKAPTPSTLMTALPIELRRRIHWMLDGFTSAQLALICRSMFATSATDHIMWKQRYYATFPSRPEEDDWLHWYREHYPRSLWLRTGLQATCDIREKSSTGQPLSLAASWDVDSDEGCVPLYWFWRYLARSALHERWRQARHRKYRIPLPVQENTQSISVLATSPWRTLIVHQARSNYVASKSETGARLYALEHANVLGDDSRSIRGAPPPMLQLQDYITVNAVEYPRVLFSGDYTVVWCIYDGVHCISWVWRRNSDGRPLTIPILKDRKCYPVALVDDLLLVCESSPRAGRSCQSFYIVDLSRFTAAKKGAVIADSNATGGCLTVNVAEGYSTCHLHQANQHVWRVYAGERHSHDASFHWQLWEITLAGLSWRNGTSATVRIIAQGAVTEPKGLTALPRNVISYAQSPDTVLLDWRPGFSMMCHYSLHQLGTNELTHDLHISDRCISLAWRHSAMPAQRTLAAFLHVDTETGRVTNDAGQRSASMHSLPHTLCRAAGDLRLASQNGYDWHVVDVADGDLYAMNQMQLSPTKAHWSTDGRHNAAETAGDELPDMAVALAVETTTATATEKDDRVRSSRLSYSSWSSSLTRCSTRSRRDEGGRSLWSLPFTFTGQAHRHTCSTHVCGVEYLHTVDTSAGQLVEVAELVLLDFAGVCLKPRRRSNDSGRTSFSLCGIHSSEKTKGHGRRPSTNPWHWIRDTLHRSGQSPKRAFASS
ncbi:hypothetical protein THASP1DRAFT_32854 [Thamnocephalis sphaerospora]|uniref:F-box domain-containing protein n=1 Tax=Thamnocephalis sphaerospora TaxID=78915 RepID=A0A4P9XJE8_9FUNG|nr:hypothetical protein THASP1DRAFT_32854 [Thamnocephalis sphaerospora]|eukprot:RKP05310.1 hypothetical protein THASP1DRAFT_32854 [Thamnocephalis sphaerospora]